MKPLVLIFLAFSSAEARLIIFKTEPALQVRDEYTVKLVVRAPAGGPPKTFEKMQHTRSPNTLQGQRSPRSSNEIPQAVKKDNLSMSSDSLSRVSTERNLLPPARDQDRPKSRSLADPSTTPRHLRPQEHPRSAAKLISGPKKTNQWNQQRGLSTEKETPSNSPSRDKPVGLPGKSYNVGQPQNQGESAERMSGSLSGPQQPRSRSPSRNDHYGKSSLYSARSVSPNTRARTTFDANQGLQHVKERTQPVSGSQTVIQQSGRGSVQMNPASLHTLPASTSLSPFASSYTISSPMPPADRANIGAARMLLQWPEFLPLNSSPLSRASSPDIERLRRSRSNSSLSRSSSQSESSPSSSKRLSSTGMQDLFMQMDQENIAQTNLAHKHPAEVTATLQGPGTIAISNFREMGGHVHKGIDQQTHVAKPGQIITVSRDHPDELKIDVKTGNGASANASGMGAQAAAFAKLEKDKGANAMVQTWSASEGKKSRSAHEGVENIPSTAQAAALSWDIDRPVAAYATIEGQGELQIQATNWQTSRLFDFSHHRMNRAVNHPLSRERTEGTSKRNAYV